MHAGQYPARDLRRERGCRYVSLKREPKCGFPQDSNSCDRSPRRAAIPNMIGRSQQMQLLREKVKTAARVSGAVLISGESGAGVELAARAIHDLSNRGGGNWVAIDCWPLADDSTESFRAGDWRAEFTTALADKPGLFE